MEKIIEDLKVMSSKYKELSERLGLPDDFGYDYCLLDNDEVIDEGRSQAYWDAHIDIEHLISSYNQINT